MTEPAIPSLPRLAFPSALVNGFRQVVRRTRRYGIRSGGTAILMVPFDATIERTEEWEGPCPEIFDHVRNYSMADFADRLPGFEVQVVHPEEHLGNDARRFAIRSTECVFICAKRSSSN